MAEQLAMAIDGGPRGGLDTRAPGRRPATATGPDASAAVRRHRGRISGNRPVRGEPDLPEPRVTRGDWRIDARTRDVGLRGLVRARAALDATARPGLRSDEVDAA